LVRWHYQWVILNDFLPRFVDCGILKEILPGFFARETCEESLTSSGYQKPNLQYYRWEEQPFIPVEFSAAVFRFGHSMSRNRYDLNYLVKKRLIIPNKASTDERLHLLGLRTLRSGWSIQWNRFLEFPAELQDGKPPLFSRKIDTNFSSKLKQLPLPLGGGDGRNLATRDLIRGYKMDLPSGQAIAQAMGEIPLDGPEAPLWYYVLREAEEMEGGLKLGPVGGRIVAEVIIGLLSGDAHSFLNVDPKWQPVYSSLDGEFQLRDILYHARMPIDETQIKSIIAR
jgi:hypothetical protein